jgi:hypothetical protein
MKKNLAAAIGVLLGMCSVGTPLHAQEEMLTPRGTFTPSVSLSETYTESLVIVTAEDGTSSHQIESATSLSVSIKASMRGVSLSTPVEDTPVSVSFGSFFHEGTLGEAIRETITGKRGKVTEKALFTFSEDEEDPDSPRATVTYTWDAKTLTIKIAGDIAAFAEDYSGEESGRFTDSDSVSVEFGTGSGEGDLKIVGKVKTRKEIAGMQQVELSDVNLSARLKQPRLALGFQHGFHGNTYQGGSLTVASGIGSFMIYSGGLASTWQNSDAAGAILWLAGISADERTIPVVLADRLSVLQTEPASAARLGSETLVVSDTLEGTFAPGAGSILSPGSSAATLTIHQPRDEGWDRPLELGALYINPSAEMVLAEAPAVDTEVALGNSNGVESWSAPDSQAALVWAKYSGFYQPAAEILSPPRLP